MNKNHLIAPYDFCGSHTNCIICECDGGGECHIETEQTYFQELMHGGGAHLQKLENFRFPIEIKCIYSTRVLLYATKLLWNEVIRHADVFVAHTHIVYIFTVIYTSISLEHIYIWFCPRTISVALRKTGDAF